MACEFIQLQVKIKSASCLAHQLDYSTFTHATPHYTAFPLAAPLQSSISWLRRGQATSSGLSFAVHAVVETQAEIEQLYCTRSCDITFRQLEAQDLLWSSRVSFSSEVDDCKRRYSSLSGGCNFASNEPG